MGSTELRPELVARMLHGTLKNPVGLGRFELPTS